MNWTRTTLGLIGWLLACFGATSRGAVFLPGEWYVTLKKPSLNPPDWIFDPGWSPHLPSLCGKRRLPR